MMYVFVRETRVFMCRRYGTVKGGSERKVSQ